MREKIDKLFNRSETLPFILLFALSFFVRIYASGSSIAQIYPDEIYQTVEMAHKLAFGQGFTYWEFNVGARSWFLPGILAGVYKTLDFFGVKDPLGLNIGIKIFLSIFHSLAVSTVYLIFRKWQLGRKEAFLFSLPLAASFLLSYISARTLSESASLPFMVFALYHASSYLETEDKKQLFFAVLASGIAYMIRFQTCIFAFGLAIALFCISKKRLKTALAFGFGYIGMMLLQGLLDIFTWGSFCKSIITYLDYNILRGVADKHGVSPWYFYAEEIASTFHPITWVSALALMLVSFIKANKFRRLFLFSFPFFFFFVLHSAISHKEPRFVFACYFAVIALSCAFFAFLYQRYGSKREEAALFFSIFMLFSLDAVPHLKFAELWNHSASTDNFYGSDKGVEKSFGGTLETSAELGRIMDLKRAYICGIPRIWGGGYAYFHKDAPLHYASDSRSILQFLREASDSAWEGSYFAVKKGIRFPEKYRKQLKKTGENDDFTIYLLETEEKLKEIPLSDLPKQTENKTKWSAEENVIMSRSGVKVSLGKAVMPSKIKISLDSSDSYRLTFFNGGEAVGELLILPAKKRSGMFEHSRDIPHEVAEKGFDSILIVPVESDGACSLGSINFQ